MTLVRGAFALALGLLLRTLPAEGAPSQPSTDKILDAIHPAESLSLAEQMIDEALTRRKKEDKISKERGEEIMSLVKRIYPAKNLYKVFKVAYAKQISPDNVALVYKWTTTPIGIKLRQALQSAYAAGPAAPAAYAKKVGVIKPNRRNAIETYANLSEKKAYFAAWKFGADLAIARALNAYKPAAEREQSADILRSVEARKGLYDTDAIAKTYVATAFLVKDLKNEEIDDLSKFVSTSHGMAHTKAINAALEGTLASAATTLEAQIVKQRK